MLLRNAIPNDPESNREYYTSGLTICFGDLSKEAKEKYCAFLAMDFCDEDEIAGDLMSFISAGYIEAKRSDT